MSQARKGGLGRGLAALIPTGPEAGPRLGNAAADVIIGKERTAADVEKPALAKVEKEKTASAPTPTPPVRNTDEDLEPAGAVYREIAPSQIRPNPKQPRSVFDEEALAELVHSIREFGLMQPIVVRALGDDKYELVMGERRWRASQEAGLESIPAIVRETTDDAMLRDALLENIHRVQLNPLEEAAAYQQLLEEFEVTHEELAAKIGRSRPVVTNMIRLLKLPIPVQRRVAAGVLSAGHARALLSLDAGSDAQEALAARIVAEGLSVRATEEAVTLANRNDDGSPSPAPRRKPIQMPGLQDVADRLSDSFDTRVTVSLGKRKGKIVVEFGSVDDLQRIVDMMENQKGK
ncbi:ParB/RepB/Spo0J family partition protein [Rhodococcus sp. BP-252]|uniref:ParB/RepB/Spo0J family partition protein n=1 Tax=unclassified Rhodococcus (in: high G+C Gram-positive bacteria) TaxID=192944 RepID=UPI001C9AFE3C|nr:MULTISPECIES: ParB/RepB/Spo0J family partition protein [unclassified Rhodococcus (in: high G+C Gram-positive bacteria)]MBY6411937.1 ParB/RepB/Spo0J family partition protein [Rhodococcus sp. BP-320]MBY6416435.1 ParB/RepB/Spo0J family partition protein [Rhodococcus sp. BP-321]MBY6420759.1 ParB/RepB/Spo0J family partition protein [Rhodococcus sp. BP-324]MBY6426459.1 ParB/RepB/Spo0J family partition protein [Rhodococcus sp. BP-323]MBY6431458.1 ParB/RepB/Spo0J family partition protein [Rhodococc